MKTILQDAKTYILRLDKDEEVIAGIAQFMQEQGIKACAFNAIGTCSKATLGYFNAHLKQYRQKPFLEDLEIVSMTGNGSMLEPDNKPIVHAHGVFSRNDYSMTAGHIFDVTVLATCELTLTVLEGEMKRQHNEEFGLNLLIS